MASQSHKFCPECHNYRSLGPCANVDLSNTETCQHEHSSVGCSLRNCRDIHQRNIIRCLQNQLNKAILEISFLKNKMNVLEK
jgi:hypothetical protein